MPNPKLNDPEDVRDERNWCGQVGTALLNVLEDSDSEIRSLKQSALAFFNILDDVDLERGKVAAANKRIEAANLELEEFAYAAAHDLKAPLRVIDNASKWLEEDLQEHLSDETRETMNMLRGRVMRMERLLDDLLEYSRIGRNDDAGFAEIVAGDVLMENVVGLLAVPKGFTVTVSPAFSEIRVGRMPLQQILINLIGNAIKHHDKTTGRIEVTVDSTQSYHDFAVTDDGPGVEPQFHKKIFKMFQTLRPRDQVEGSGMGLAMVRKSVETYGGTIELLSAKGKGSTFCFTWPKLQKRPRATK